MRPAPVQPPADLPLHLVVGDPRHGVTRYALAVAAATSAEVLRTEGFDDLDDLDALGLDGARRLHVHFTDRLFGSSPAAAASRIERLAGVANLTVTLHDVPQESDGAVSLARRIDGYARVISAAKGVVCNSGHELALLREHVLPGVRAEVIHLPVDRSVANVNTLTTLEPEVAILGFIYPGKGHAEVLEAVASARSLVDEPRLGVSALGAPSPGHERDVERLALRAAGLGVTFATTGYLDDVTLSRRLRQSAVPVAAHQHVSASGSIATWIEAGRRPLIPDSRYSREMAELRPGTVTVYGRGGLGRAIERAFADPASTFLGDGADTAPGLADVAAHYTRWWSTGVAW